MNRRETVNDPRVGRVETIPHIAGFAAILPSFSHVLRLLNATLAPDA